MTLLIWLVLDKTGSPFWVALVGFFGMIPLLLFGAVGGVLADRVDRRKLLRFTQLINLAAGLVMLALLLTGMVQYWHSYIVVLASGLGWAFDMPARRSMVLDVTGRVGVTNAMALDSVGMHASRMIGPAFAGLLIQTVSLTGGYVVIIALYLISLAFLMRLKLPPRENPSTTLSITRNLAEGFVYVRSNRVILGTVIVTVLMNLLLFPYMQMVPGNCERDSARRPRTYGHSNGRRRTGRNHWIGGNRFIRPAQIPRPYLSWRFSDRARSGTGVRGIPVVRGFPAGPCPLGPRNSGVRHHAIDDCGYLGIGRDEGTRTWSDLARNWSWSDRSPAYRNTRRSYFPSHRNRDLRGSGNNVYRGSFASDARTPGSNGTVSPRAPEAQRR